MYLMNHVKEKNLYNWIKLNIFFLYILFVILSQIYFKELFSIIKSVY